MSHRPRCYLAPEAWTAGDLSLEGEEAHHLARVLRAHPGFSVEVFDGCGRSAAAVVRSVARQRVILAAEPPVRHPKSPGAVRLVQAFPKGPQLDFILQKAVELGAAGVVLADAEHAVARWRAADAPAHLARARRIVINAAKQCGAVWLPAVELAAAPERGWPEDDPHGVRVFGSLSPDAPPLRLVLEAAAGRPAAGFTACVGPEGGFSAEEEDRLRATGGRPVNLGPLILRTDTAAFFFLVAAVYAGWTAPSPGLAVDAPEALR